jgi:NADH-quinone oxidoreductase subunit L
MSLAGVTTGFLFLSAVLSWVVFSQWTWGGLEPSPSPTRRSSTSGISVSNWSFRLDGLSAVMLVVVTTVSRSCTSIRWGYMAETIRQAAVLRLPVAVHLRHAGADQRADFMQLFFGWEGVGLASYLLIGFWHHKPTANAAAIKAFVVNRVGDFGFALGIMTVFWASGPIEFASCSR